LRLILSETFTKTRKKRLRKWLICESFFFSWSPDLVRCCGNCPKYSFCFLFFSFEVQSFMVKASFICFRAANFFVCFFLIFLIFGKIYNKVWGILLLQLLQKDLRNNHFLTEDMERLRVVVLKWGEVKKIWACCQGSRARLQDNSRKKNRREFFL